MSTPSMQPRVQADLTITIENEKSVKFDPPLGTVPMGGVVRFRSGDHKRWEVELWNKDNTVPYPLRLFVPEHDGVEMIADPAVAPPVNVNFNILKFPSGKSGPTTDGGTYTIKITSNAGDGK
jgi:hypothetical protein